MAKNRKLRWVLWLLVLVVAVGAVIFYVKRREKQQGEDKYRVETVGRGDVTMTVTATGSISAVTTVQVGSQVSGIIASLHADFNSNVKKGQLLAELDPTNFQAMVQQRRADLLQNEVQMRAAEISFHRQERLLADNLASQSDYDAAKAGFEAAEAQVEQSKAALAQAVTNLEYTKIASPIDGVVVARQYDVGQTVAASFQAPTLFTIAQDLTKMQVQADVDQSDIGRVQIGQPVRFSVDAYPEHEFRGKIAQIRLNATANQNVITYPVIVEVPNPDGKLRPQMTANVTIEVATVANVLRIPNAALRFRPTQGAGDAKSASATGERAPGASGGARAQGTAGGASPEQRIAQAAQRRPGLEGAAAALEGGMGAHGGRGMQTVYLLAGKNEIKAAKVRVGISDGKFTEISEGEVQPGDKIVVGQATAKAENSSRPPGGGRMF
ncbi:MAG: efflux RND transporter periplasmic adaptor subunit [Acidobacteriia bacterium]|nr:efflux RND transporter periplasmic adaptor subunit [Terriglobia bacterium]